MAGDVFQLGNTSYRILRVERGRVRVEDAQGQPPSIPFWLGEAPGRSDRTVGRRVAPARGRCCSAQLRRATARRRRSAGCATSSALARGRPRAQLVDYCAPRSRPRFGVLPTQQTHRAGALLRRIRRHPAGDPFALRQPHQPRLGPGAAQALLPQVQLRAAGGGHRGRDRPVAVHQPQLPADRGRRATCIRPAPSTCWCRRCSTRRCSGARWRWNATTALALPRFTGGKKVPPQLQRMKSRGPAGDGVPRPGRLPGEHRRRTRDARPSAGRADPARLPARGDGRATAGWRCCAGWRRARSQVVARDLTAPVAARRRGAERAPLRLPRRRAAGGAPHPGGAARGRWRRCRSAGDLGRLDPAAIDAVREEAWPQARDADEMHDALMALGVVTARRGATASRLAGRCWRRLAADARATRLQVGNAGLWVAAERLPQLQAVHPRRSAQPPSRGAGRVSPRDVDARGRAASSWCARACPASGRDHRSGAGGGAGGASPTRSTSRCCALEQRRLRHARPLHVRTRRDDEWCERHLLARIHRYTIGAAAARDRAGRARATSCASCSTGSTLSPATRVQRAGRAGRRAGAAGRLRGAGRRVGKRTAAGARRRTIRSPGWTICAAPAASPGRACARAATRRRRRRCAARPIVLLPRRRAGAVDARWRRASSPARMRRCPRARRRVADCLRAARRAVLRRTAGRRRACCAPNWKTRWPSWSRAAASAATASPACARCCCRRRSAVGHAAPRPARVADRDRGCRALERWCARPAAWQTADGPDRRSNTSPASCCAATAWCAGACWSARRAWLPPWRELLRVYHRLEARGEIRGGRFVAGAGRRAVRAARSDRPRCARCASAPHDGALIAVSAQRSAQPGRHAAARRQGAAPAGARVLCSRRRAGGVAGGRRVPRLARVGACGRTRREAGAAARAGRAGQGIAIAGIAADGGSVGAACRRTRESIAAHIGRVSAPPNSRGLCRHGIDAVIPVPRPCGQALAVRIRSRRIRRALRVRICKGGTTKNPVSSTRGFFVVWRSLRDSNPCFSLERATSWASRRREHWLQPVGRPARKCRMACRAC